MDESYMKRNCNILIFCWIIVLVYCQAGFAWNDETHLAIAKAAGFKKWYHAAGADMVKLKLGKREAHNHYVNNRPGMVVTPQMVMAQVKQYNRVDDTGHLYGAIIHTLRDYRRAVRAGQYGAYHLSFCAHYIGDLSQPLHHMVYNAFNRKKHQVVDGVVNHEVLENLDRIKLYPIRIGSEKDLAKEIARIANLALRLAERMESEDRLPTHQEAYNQISHSASLFKAVLNFVEGEKL